MWSNIQIRYHSCFFKDAMHYCNGWNDGWKSCTIPTREYQKFMMIHHRNHRCFIMWVKSCWMLDCCPSTISLHGFPPIWMKFWSVYLDTLKNRVCFRKPSRVVGGEGLLLHKGTALCCSTGSWAALWQGTGAMMNWLVVSTQLKNISQNGNLSQIGIKMKNIWNHHLVKL